VNAASAVVLVLPMIWAAAVEPTPVAKELTVWVKPLRSRIPTVPLPPRVRAPVEKALFAPRRAVPLAMTEPPV
jgi:hypothetical protein